MEKWFGRTYEGIGSIDKDLILKTKGEVKIQIGKRFVDIIKNGKIAGGDSSGYFSKINSVDDIKSNGIYICNNDVYLKIDDSIIQISGDESQTYVSYLSIQETSSEQKSISKQNIGLQFNSLNDALNAVEKGLVFIDDKIYYISNGTFSEYGNSFPNPYSDQIVIDKNNSKLGSLVLLGGSIENGLIIENSKIFEQDSALKMDSTRIVFTCNGNDILELNQNGVISNNILSLNYTSDSGFKLNSDGGQSVLEVDKVIERQKKCLWNTIVYVINNSDQQGITITNSIKSNGIYIKVIDEDDQIIPVYPILHSPIQSYLKITNSDNYQKVTYTIAQSCDLYYKMTLEFNVYDFDVTEAKYLGVYWYDGSNYNPLPFYVTNTYGNEYTEPIDPDAQTS